MEEKHEEALDKDLEVDDETAENVSGGFVAEAAAGGSSASFGSKVLAVAFRPDLEKEPE